MNKYNNFTVKNYGELTDKQKLLCHELRCINDKSFGVMCIGNAIHTLSISSDLSLDQFDKLIDAGIIEVKEQCNTK